MKIARTKKLKMNPITCLIKRVEILSFSVFQTKRENDSILWFNHFIITKSLEKVYNILDVVHTPSSSYKITTEMESVRTEQILYAEQNLTEEI